MGPGYTLLSLQTHVDTHSHPSNCRGAHCLLEARLTGDIMTAAIVCEDWDGRFIMDWQSSKSPWLRKAVGTLSARIGRADVTFSWPLPCWSLLWGGRGDNDMAYSPGWRGALCAPCHAWPLTFTSQYLSLSFITSPPWWISLLSCVHKS